MMPARRSAGLHRSIALLLFAVFLGAGTTLPGTDALLYHWGQPDATEHQAHIEPAGGCASHTDACTLGRAASGAGADLAHAPQVRADAPARSRVEPDSGLRHVAFDRGVLPQPRAPPPLRNA
jgi:hypothetical protein